MGVRVIIIIKQYTGVCTHACTCACACSWKIKNRVRSARDWRPTDLEVRRNRKLRAGKGTGLGRESGRGGGAQPGDGLDGDLTAATGRRAAAAVAAASSLSSSSSSLTTVSRRRHHHSRQSLFYSSSLTALDVPPLYVWCVYNTPRLSTRVISIRTTATVILAVTKKYRWRIIFKTTVSVVFGRTTAQNEKNVLKLMTGARKIKNAFGNVQSLLYCNV